MSAPLSPALRGVQRKWLRAQAHPLRPVVQVGGSGVSPSVVRAIDDALADHELVKVRLLAPPDKKAMARELAEATRSHLCGLVGHTVILYRPDPEAPQIELPE
jgi:RNA-binding protein